MTRPIEYTLTFSGAGEQEIQARGRYLLINDAGGDVWVSINHGSELLRGKKSNIAAGEEITNFRIRSAIAQTVRVTLSEVMQGEGRDDVSVTASATIAPANQITSTTDKSIPATTADTILAGNVNRLAVTIKSLSSNTDTIRIGDSGGVGANSGHPLEPGESITLACTDLISGYNTGAAAQSVSILEMETI